MMDYETSTRISYTLYKPERGYTIEDVLNYVKSLASSLTKKGCIKSVVLKSMDSSWVSLLSLWPSQQKDYDFSKEEEDECVVKGVNWRWYDQTCQQLREGKKGGMFSVKVGDVMNVRRIYGSQKKMEALEYSCLAVLRSYFQQMVGLQWYQFYKCSEGRRILGFGVWESVGSATAVKLKGSPAESFWKSLGAKILKFDITTVTFVAS